MPLTLEDIARIAGVSRSTVSRVINGDEKVKAETRERVEAVIRELNFQPNLAARSLAAHHTGIIGVVIPAGVSQIFADPYFGILIQGASSACNSHDYSMMLWLAEPAYERRTIRQILHSGLVDGVLVSSMLIDDPIVQALYESKMPFILIGRHPRLQVNYVDVDNIDGAQKATLHLLTQGRRRVATISGPHNMIAGIDRLQGYRNALEIYGIPYDPELVAEGDFSERSGYEAAQKLIPKHPDAMFIANDVMALGALRALRQARLRVPEDVAIVGYDDGPAANQFEPPLTTVYQPIHEMGLVAIETLLDIIHNPTQETRRVVMETRLIVRASCGAITI